MGCREVGHSSNEINPEHIELTHLIYNASGGTEDFISAEDISTDSLVGFLRLRAPNQPFRQEINENTCLIRELHVYGRMAPVGQHLEGNWQHKGWGEALMDEAEKTASDDYDARKIVFMSALGTKQYYKRLGYEEDGPYVSKVL